MDPSAMPWTRIKAANRKDKLVALKWRPATSLMRSIEREATKRGRAGGSGLIFFIPARNREKASQKKREKETLRPGCRCHEIGSVRLQSTGVAFPCPANATPTSQTSIKLELFLCRLDFFSRVQCASTLNGRTVPRETTRPKKATFIEPKSLRNDPAKLDVHFSLTRDGLLSQSEEKKVKIPQPNKQVEGCRRLHRAGRDQNTFH